MGLQFYIPVQHTRGPSLPHMSLDIWRGPGAGVTQTRGEQDIGHGTLVPVVVTSGDRLLHGNWCPDSDWKSSSSEKVEVDPGSNSMFDTASALLIFTSNTIRIKCNFSTDVVGVTLVTL